MAVFAFFLVFWLSLCVTTIILVGAYDVAPRQAALSALVPALALGVVCASVRPLRQFFGSIFMVG